jgi:ribosomal protein S18 acetylase RimI-like enzyme
VVLLRKSIPQNHVLNSAVYHGVRLFRILGNYMEIRYLMNSDRSEICKLSHQINRDHYLNEPEVFCKPVAEGEDWLFWKESHEKDGGFVLVAVSNSSVVGFVAAEVSEMPNLPFLNPIKHCRIATIVVSSKHQKNGIGSALYERVCEIDKEQGADRLTLEVFTFNLSAVAFYEKHGFKSTAMHMSKSLA